MGGARVREPEYSVNYCTTREVQTGSVKLEKFELMASKKEPTVRTPYCTTIPTTQTWQGGTTSDLGDRHAELS
jgi:hypothetical protein